MACTNTIRGKNQKSPGNGTIYFVSEFKLENTANKFDESINVRSMWGVKILMKGSKKGESNILTRIIRHS